MGRAEASIPSAADFGSASAENREIGCGSLRGRCEATTASCRSARSKRRRNSVGARQTRCGSYAGSTEHARSRCAMQLPLAAMVVAPTWSRLPFHGIGSRLCCAAFFDGEPDPPRRRKLEVPDRGGPKTGKSKVLDQKGAFEPAFRRVPRISFGVPKLKSSAVSNHDSTSATALPHIWVVARPPRSGVRSFSSARTVSMAETMAAPAAASPK
jgi:hypothetical protein